jgi:AraC-like DNA-binding protein
LQSLRQFMIYKIDLFAIFIFVGIVQAIFLSLFFFSKNNRKIETNVYQGIMVLAMAACTFEIFLCYTGYIIHCLWLVDFSEPISYLIGPSFYLMIISLINGKTDKTRYYHFLFAALWLIIQMPFFVQSEDVKFNAWIGAYHTEGLTFREVNADFFSSPYHSEIILTHLCIYMILGLIATVKAFRAKKESIWKTKHATFLQLRSAVGQIVFVTLLIIVVKLFYREDTGDHLFASYISIAIYLISFQVIRQSGFFIQPSLIDQQKYKSSSLSRDDQTEILKRLKVLMATEKPFLQTNFSLPDLASQLKISTHQLSQVINDGLGKSFFEMTAEYRIDEAKKLLKEKMNIKVEEIAEQVGYNSKSSFNTAFKKIVGVTPSEWRG